MSWRRGVARLLWALTVVVGVVTVTFAVARTLPGDPVAMILGPQARPDDVARARAIYALDEPLWVQYGRFWSRLLHLDTEDDDAHRSCVAPFDGRLHVDLGFSHRYRQPVAALLAKKVPASLELALVAVMLQLGLGLGIGVAAARRRDTLYDQLAVGATVVGTCTPIFALGLTLQYILAYRLAWLPHDGYADDPWGRLRHVALPALTLGLYGAALYTRLARDEVVRALDQSYVRASRARGASRRRALLVHGLRNALLPIATLAVLELGALIGGAVVTEKLFRWPGVGAMAVDAMVHRDGAVIVGVVLFGAIAVVAASLAVDALALWLDPRLRR